MKTIFISMKVLLSFMFVLSINTISAQMAVVSSGSADLAKDAVKGRFAGTYVKPDGSAELFYLTADGIYGYNFSANGKFSKESTGDAVMTDLLTMQDAESQTEELSKLPDFQGDVIMGSSTWTKNLAVKTGTLYLDASDKFIYGPEFDEKETIKPKVDETWMSKQIGYRSYAPFKKVALTNSNGKKVVYTFAESGPFVIAPADGGSIQGAGVVVEKVSIRNPSSNNQNTLAIFSIPANDPHNMNTNVIVTPYSMQGIGTGITSSDGFAVMTMPINAPSTYKPHKRLAPPEDKRVNLFVYRLNKENEVLDSVNFPSSSSVVTFQYMSEAATNTDVIFGFGNDKKIKWHWGFADMDLNVMQFIKLDDNGQIEIHKTYLEDEIHSKLIIPGAKSNKIKLKLPVAPVWHWMTKFSNGNFFFYGKGRYNEFAMLIDSKGELIHFYVMLINEATYNLGAQIHLWGNNIYLAVYDQPYEFSNAVTTDVSYTPYTKTTKTTQLFEIFHITQLIKINIDNGAVEHLELGEKGKEYYTMHNNPVVFGKDAIYVAGREKGPKGKEIFFEKISY